MVFTLIGGLSSSRRPRPGKEDDPPCVAKLKA
jgi:hypothetical protein